MGLAGIVFAVFTTGYILGVWVACLVLRQPQAVDEDGPTMSPATARVIGARAVVGAERRL